MADLDLKSEVAAFLRARASLRAEHKAPWVVFAAEQFQAAFDEYEGAARFAFERFPNVPSLVRHLDDDDEYVPLIFADDE
jgi:hypothetical protein